MRYGVVWTGGHRRVATGILLASIPLTVLGSSPAVAAPAPTKPLQALINGTIWGDAKADAKAKDPLAGAYDAKLDAGSLYTVTTAIGARDVWKKRDAAGRAITGKGVTVAVLDSGVAAVPGLNAPGKVVQGPDLSLETNSAAVLSRDTFGHGTHMASIIAGRAPTSLSGPATAPAPSGPNDQLGVAPDAQVLAMKLATTDGSTDVSQVIAGLDWVVQHQDDAGMDVRVVNLSFGTDSVQPYQVDPLAAAAENAWRHGIVVVVSGGNAGPDAGGLTDPAIDPYVIAVAASDAGGEVAGWKAPTAASFSSRGTTARHPDLMAPGRSIVGLRVPGSFVDVNNPQGRVAGDPSGLLLRGSGTSQAAAVVSGAAALLVQAHPNLTPDAVKAALVGTARPVAGVSALDGGAGEIDVAAALTATDKLATGKAVAAQLAAVAQTFPRATGLGTLDGARGSSHLVDAVSGAVLSGEVDVQGDPWVARTWAASSAAGTSWSGGRWRGALWTGSSWGLTGWQSARWSSARWSDSGWDSARWSSARWSDSGWDSARWSSARWSDASWQSARWSGGTWA